MKCPQCKNEMKKIKFDIGYGIEVNSMNCSECQFNVTPDNKMKNTIELLREKMKKEVRIIQIGNGLGIRLTNNIVKNYNLKRGEKISLKPEADGIKLLYLKT